MSTLLQSEHAVVPPLQPVRAWNGIAVLSYGAWRRMNFSNFWRSDAAITNAPPRIGNCLRSYVHVDVVSTEMPPDVSVTCLSGCVSVPIAVRLVPAAGCVVPVLETTQRSMAVVMYVCAFAFCASVSAGGSFDGFTSQ